MSRTPVFISLPHVAAAVVSACILVGIFTFRVWVSGLEQTNPNSAVSLMRGYQLDGGAP